MTNTWITPKNDATSMSIDLSNVDIDYALQRGRRLRSEAFSSVLKSLFSGLGIRRGLWITRGRQADNGRDKGSFSPDCTAPA